MEILWGVYVGRYVENYTGKLTFTPLRTVSMSRPKLTIATATSPHRQRAHDRADGVLAQVQQRAVGADDGPAVLHRLVVPQGRGVLPPARVVRAPDVVARAAVRAHGLRVVRRVADGVPARHQGRGARRARGHEPESERKCECELERKSR